MWVGPQSTDVTVFWHRRDLRTTDNRGLAAAASDGPPVPVFVLDESVLAHAERREAALDAFRPARGE